MNKYNYDLQVWTRDGIITPCGHPDNMKPACCTAGKYHGLMVKHAAQLIEQARQTRAGTLPDNMKRDIFAAIDYTIEELRRTYGTTEAAQVKAAGRF